MFGCVCNARQGTSFSTVTLCGSSHSSWYIMEQSVRLLRQFLLLPHFPAHQRLCLRQSSNTFLHVLTPIKHLSVCWTGVQIRVSLHSKDVSHPLNQIRAARLLHWMDHGQGQMLRTKADFAKSHLDVIIDKKSCFKCGKFTYKNIFY